MNLMNEQVRHHQFGIGTITGQTTTTVKVEFCQQQGVKNFLYPSAFESFLELCGPASQALMNDELRQSREQIEAARKKREEEKEKRLEEEQRALLEQKRASAKKRSSAKKIPAKPKRQPEPANERDDI
ncbi:MAG: hypothetical protein AB7C97_08325 [Oscillospiraceae bacterium]